LKLRLDWLGSVSCFHNFLRIHALSIARWTQNPRWESTPEVLIDPLKFFRSRVWLQPFAQERGLFLKVSRIGP
jgi:hypothetical protein